MSAPTTPVAAASVGVATPSMIRPITMKKTKTDGSIRTRAMNTLPPVLRSAASTARSGASDGVMRTRITT